MVATQAPPHIFYFLFFFFFMVLVVRGIVVWRECVVLVEVVQC